MHVIWNETTKPVRYHYLNTCIVIGKLYALSEVTYGFRRFREIKVGFREGVETSVSLHNIQVKIFINLFEKHIFNNG